MLYATSRYLHAGSFLFRGEVIVLGMRPRCNFNLTDATYYSVVAGDTLDAIAYKHYKNSRLSWAIMDANRSYQTELEIQAGDILCIPPFEEVVKFCE